MAAQTDVYEAPAPTGSRMTVTGLVARVAVAALLAAFVIGLPLSGSDEVKSDAALAAIFAVVGISMNILVGYAGQISLGQQGFVGMGSMVAANLVNAELTPADPFSFALCIAAATGIGAATALVLGLVALRISGLYLALVTLVFGIVVADAVFALESLNGESAGVTAIRPDSISAEGRFFLFCLLFVALVVYVDWAFTRTKAGRAVNAVRENELVAQAFAVDVVRYKLLAFSLSGAIAGLAGALLVFWSEGFSDKDFVGTAGFNKALIFLAMVVVGGLGSRAGVVIASAFFGLLDPLLTEFFNLVGAEVWFADHKNFMPGLIGAVLLLQTVIMNPGGVGQVVKPVSRWLSGGRFSFHDDDAGAHSAHGGRHARA